MKPTARRIALFALAPLLLFGVVCGGKPTLTISAPVHGLFTLDSSVVVSGTVANVAVSSTSVRVNGTPATLNPDGTWSVTMPVDATAVVNPFYAEMVQTATGGVLDRKRVVVIYGDSVADGDFSLQSLGLRINDTGLQQLEPVIATGVSIDPATLLPVGSVVISNYCAIPGPFGTCLGRETATVASPPPSISGFSIATDSMTGFVAGDVTVDDLRIDLNLSGSGLAPSCGLRLTASTTQILGDYALQPLASDPHYVDVNEIGDPVVQFTGFTQTFTSGICDFPLIGNLIQLIVGNVEPTVVTGFENFLKDPDGAGPQDAPVAAAIQTALAGISISGPAGDTLQVNLDTPLFDVVEDTDGITLGSDTRVTSSPVSGTPGPGQCAAVAGAPDLTASYEVSEAFPSFGTTTPGGLPYQIAISISTSAFNQLLKAQIECGLLQTSLTELDLNGTTIPLTAGALATFVPALANGYDPSLPLRIDLKPTLAPFLTGNTGPGGEMGEIRIPQLELSLVIDDGLHNATNGLMLRGALDARAGLGMTFTSGTLGFSVSSVTDVKIAFLNNLIGANETQLAAVLNYLLPQVLPSLGSGLGAFPLPTFFGLQLQGVEVSRNGQFYTIFANLVPGP